MKFQPNQMSGVGVMIRNVVLQVVLTLLSLGSVK